MTLGHMRANGIRSLAVWCLARACSVGAYFPSLRGTLEAPMATYVLLVNFTDQGIRGVKDTIKLTCFPVSGPVFAGKFQFSGT